MAHSPIDDPLDVLVAWNQAFVEADVDKMVQLYATDAVFFGTSTLGFTDSSAAIRDYFVTVLRQRKPKDARTLQAFCQPLQTGLVAIATLDRLEWEAPSQVAWGRTSMILAKRKGRWSIVHFHRSSVPSP